jgi:hypothetical protein
VEAPKGPSLSEIRTHALAFNAILDSQNGALHSTLADTLDPAYAEGLPEKQRASLGESWGVSSRAELLQMLESIRTGEHGHRGRYWKMRERLLKMPIEDRSNIYMEIGPDLAPSAHIVEQQLSAPLGKAMPITAWDFGRYINLCRAGYNAGWLSEDDAWNLILPVARMLQSSYHSWDEFAADYLVGRDFWNPSMVIQNEKFRYIIMLLERQDGGLWASIPWNESLGKGPTMEDPMALAILKNYTPRNQNMPMETYIPPDGPKMMRVRTGVDPR